MKLFDLILIFQKPFSIKVLIRELKRYDEALLACNEAIRLNPNFSIAFFHKGIILRDHKRYDEALLANNEATT